MLIEVAANHPDKARALVKSRHLLNEAFAASQSALQQELFAEQKSEMDEDRHYWAPLKRELETLRRQRRG